MTADFFDIELKPYIELFDEVFSELNVPGILDNNTFRIDAETLSNYYVRFVRTPSAISVGLSIIISKFDVQIDIDRTSETFIWSEKLLTDSRKRICILIRMILTSYITVDYYGSNYTKFTFIDHRNQVVDTRRVITGLYLKINRLTKQYDPIVLIPA